MSSNVIHNNTTENNNEHCELSSISPSSSSSSSTCSENSSNKNSHSIVSIISSSTTPTSSTIITVSKSKSDDIDVSTASTNPQSSTNTTKTLNTLISASNIHSNSPIKNQNETILKERPEFSPNPIDYTKNIKQSSPIEGKEKESLSLFKQSITSAFKVCKSNSKSKQSVKSSCQPNINFNNDINSAVNFDSKASTSNITASPMISNPQSPTSVIANSNSALMIGANPLNHLHLNHHSSSHLHHLNGNGPLPLVPPIQPMPPPPHHPIHHPPPLPSPHHHHQLHSPLSAVHPFDVLRSGPGASSSNSTNATISSNLSSQNKRSRSPMLSGSMEHHGSPLVESSFQKFLKLSANDTLNSNNNSDEDDALSVSSAVSLASSRLSSHHPSASQQLQQLIGSGSNSLVHDGPSPFASAFSSSGFLLGSGSHSSVSGGPTGTGSGASKHPSFSSLASDSALAVINAAAFSSFAAAAGPGGSGGSGNSSSVVGGGNNSSGSTTPTSPIGDRSGASSSGPGRNLRHSLTPAESASDSSRHPKCSKCRNHGSRVPVKSKWIILVFLKIVEQTIILGKLFRTKTGSTF